MQTTLIVIGVIIGSLIYLLFRAKSRLKNLPSVENHEKIIVLSEQNFQQQTRNRVVLVDFWASWCGPCKVIAPILNEVAVDLSNGAFVGKVDVDKHQSLVQKFKVRGIPTLILFKNGKEVDRFVGVKSKNFLLKEISKHQI